MATYRPVPPKVDLPALEHEILRFWADHDVFHESVRRSEGRPTWVFYEGPPTANGRPGTHHVEARVFKDVLPRYRTMKGYHVPRHAGWDCHGLPVELAVERELGFSGKKDIEAYGIAEFNARCRESVERHVDEFSALTHRMGFWVDMEQAYWTMAPEYIESVWWSLQQIFTKGLLVQDHRVAPYCPRCGTGLSDHELAQGYEEVVDPSAYVRFPLTGGALAERHPGLALLVWTTTPWTLVSNTAAAVHPDLTYEIARWTRPDGRAETLVVAQALRESLLGEDSEVLETLTGHDLIGLHYQRPLDWLTMPEHERMHTVLPAEFVTAEDGTGIVHEAPAFGAEDLALCRSFGLPVVNPIHPDGQFDADVPVVGNTFFKDADALVLAALREGDLLFKKADYQHNYPHCWRCHTPLMYYAQPSWYIRTTAIKDALLRENESTSWYPETIKWGRYGDWLHNNIDWALSRTRYWGTPLPIWRCTDGHLQCVGSLAELGALAGRDVSEIDPHRPFIDDVTFPCSTCGQTATRVPEVIDCWYDSGAMPFAQWGYPHRNADLFTSRYPADFVCEAIDQTRGWFYTLMAIGTLVFDQSSYRNVVCLGHIVDEQGRKMSKHLGNVLEPIPLMDEHGADAVRWFMAASGSPWSQRRVGHATIQEVVRKNLLTYWNTVSFLALYARETDVNPALVRTPVAERPALDRWALAHAHRLARDVDGALEAFDTQRAGRLIADFIDDLSNWYVRRSRRRFWDGDANALGTLHECLRILTQVMAPFTPFITERVWQDLFVTTEPNAVESVHLSSWPQVSDDLIDEQLIRDMDLVRRLVELGRAARAESSVKTRQPLARALVSASGWDDLSDDLRSQVREEINVLQIDSLTTQGDLVDVSVKANFRALGKRFGSNTQQVAAAVAQADATAIVMDLRNRGEATIQVEGSPVTITSEELIVTETPRTGWAVAADGGETLALDLDITPELRRAGLAREVIRLVQDTRKSAGFEVSDRIRVVWTSTDPDVAAAIGEHAATISGEVLAVELTEGSPSGDYTSASDDTLALTVGVLRV